MKKQYLLFADFWREKLRRQFLLCLAALLLLALAGYASAEHTPAIGEGLVSLFVASANVEELASLPPSELMISLLSNNVSAMFSPLLFGLIPFLYFPAVTLCSNSFLLGAFAAYYCQHGLSFGSYLAGILPHGIFELSALALCCGAGLYLCGCVTGRILHREGCDPIGRAVVNCARTFWCVILPLLVVAAFTEAFITPLVMEQFIS